MTLDLGAVALAELDAVAAALESGRLRTPLTKMALLQYATSNLPGREALESTASMGFTPAQAAAVLRAVAAERRRTQATRDSVELVWTGPALEQERSRDTSVVLRELLRSAKREILVSTYNLATAPGAKLLFSELALRMDAEPDLRVRLVLTVIRAWGDKTAAVELVQNFANGFPAIWPGKRLPQVFHFPAALVVDRTYQKMHAKCAVIDDERAFVTSANLSEAAHYRNIEAGVLVNDPGFAKQLRTEFDVLIANKDLVRVAGIGG